jgi:hypothetical protein
MNQLLAENPGVTDSDEKLAEYGKYETLYYTMDLLIKARIMQCFWVVCIGLFFICARVYCSPVEIHQ